MPIFENAELTCAEIESIEAAFARDPGLREELKLFARKLSDDARDLFWPAFAAAASGAARPAAAVLPALEAAMRGIDPEDPEPRAQAQSS